MDNKDLTALLKKFREGSLNKEEKALLENWVVFGEFKERELSDAEITAELSKVSGQLPLIAVKRKTLWPRVAGVAAAAAAIVFGVWFYTNEIDPRGKAHPNNMAYKQDIAPGRNTAVLSINGQTVQLSDAKTGLVVDKGNLAYNDGTKINAPHTLGEQTLSTPWGGTYQITLSDGTHVWLNAASSLTYSTSLNERGGVRRVKLSGEAYFEVAKDKSRLFIVESEGQKVTVLGTHFNISAYKEEGIKTTLLEGSVKLALLQGEERVLVPNQQAVVTRNAGIIVRDVDANEAIAWKNGLFMFDAERLETIMTRVARWYNVAVIYEDEELKNQVFSGSVSRFANISSLLRKLEKTAPIKFKVKDKKVIIGRN